MFDSDVGQKINYDILMGAAAKVLIDYGLLACRLIGSDLSRLKLLRLHLGPTSQNFCCISDLGTNFGAFG